MRKALITGLVALVLPASAAAADFGGVAWTEPSGDRYPLNRTVDVWHTGHAPVGGYIAYRAHLQVRWRWSLDHRFQGVSIRAYMTDEAPTLSYGPDSGVVEKYSDYQNCRIEGKLVKDGCLYVKRKFKVTHSAVPWPVSVGEIHGYPVVTVKINAAGEVLSWWWNLGIA